MTAVVAILNKTGMALAADSAATISNGDSSASKVFNTANKLFTLSKHHPISMMIYNNSEFLSTPWEIIIKVYRKQLKKNYFDTVKEYSEDFIQFLETNSLLSLANKEPEYLMKIVNDIFIDSLKDLKSLLIKESNYLALVLLDEFQVSDDLLKEHKQVINDLAIELNKIIDETSDCFASIEDLKAFKNFDFDSFKDDNHEYLEHVVDAVISKYANVLTYSDGVDKFKNNFINLIMLILQSDFIEFGHTGLVFIGYGDEQIYPALYAIETDGIISSKLRYNVTEEIVISDTNPGALAPFAQTDVMNTFIRGISPKIQTVIQESLEKTLSNTLATYNASIVQNSSGSVDHDALSNLKDISEKQIVNAMMDNIQSYLQLAHIQPTLQALRFLSKEDLAELAESLIYLTFLKRRTTSSIESVGGAIDVAIISKGDGFIWKQRKHYFDSKLNPQFLHNYFDC